MRQMAYMLKEGRRSWHSENVSPHTFRRSFATHPMKAAPTCGPKKCWARLITTTEITRTSMDAS